MSIQNYVTNTDVLTTLSVTDLKTLARRARNASNYLKYLIPSDNPYSLQMYEYLKISIEESRKLLAKYGFLG